MEIKVVCNCGQKYKFDVEPVNQRMPFSVACPVCNLDGTHLANGVLAEVFSGAPPLAAPPPMLTAHSNMGGIRQSPG